MPNPRNCGPSMLDRTLQYKPMVVWCCTNNTYFYSYTEGYGTQPYTLTVYDNYIELADKNNIKNNNVGVLYANVLTNSYLYANMNQGISCVNNALRWKLNIMSTKR